MQATSQWKSLCARGGSIILTIGSERSVATVWRPLVLQQRGGQQAVDRPLQLHCGEHRLPELGVDALVLSRPVARLLRNPTEERTGQRRARSRSRLEQPRRLKQLHDHGLIRLDLLPVRHPRHDAAHLLVTLAQPALVLQQEHPRRLQ